MSLLTFCVVCIFCFVCSRPDGTWITQSPCFCSMPTTPHHAFSLLRTAQPVYLRALLALPLPALRARMPFAYSAISLSALPLPACAAAHAPTTHHTHPTLPRAPRTFFYPLATPSRVLPQFAQHSPRTHTGFFPRVCTGLRTRLPPLPSLRFTRLFTRLYSLL